MLVPFAIVNPPAPAVAVTPLHVPVFPAVPIVIPDGNVSVNALVSVIALALVFPMVTVRFVLPPAARFATPNAFVIVGAASTVNVAEATAPVVATGDVPVGALVLFVPVPGVELVTLI
jgi:hypothetical protein